MSNTDLIRRFYSAFQKLDYATMQDSYSDEAVFQDPAFGILNGSEVKAMWEMLARNAKNFSLVFSDIKAEDEEYVSCRWIATYTFSATGKKVVNDIRAYIRVQNEKITEHTDHFSFWNWARQALGFSGLLLGWSSFVQNQVRTKARGNLQRFMEKQSVSDSEQVVSK
jgi:ketosteroid isomerase-like protein